MENYKVIVRKARELKIEKEPYFLDKRRDEITKMATESHPINPHKGEKGWFVPGGEKFRYNKGHIPAIVTNPDIVTKNHKKRNETIRIERLRKQYGLHPKTKLKLR